MHVGPRPVKGGPGRTGVNIWVQTKSHGGSRGPVDPWSAAAASKRRDLWFFRSRKNNDNTICCKKDSRRAKPKNQATRPRPLGPIKKKSSVRGKRGCGDSRRVTAPGTAGHGPSPPHPHTLWFFRSKEHRNCCPCNYRFPPKTAILYKRRQESAKSCAGGAGGRAPAINDPAAAPPRGNIEETAAFATS